MRGLWILALLWVLCWSAARAADSEIVPGVRVGPARLGDDMKALTLKAGSGRSIHQGEYTKVVYKGYIVMISDAGKKVDAVVVTDPPFKLKNGIGIGSTEAQILKLLGPPSKSKSMGEASQGMIDKSLNYDRLGMALVLAGGKVVQIAIYPKKAVPPKPKGK